MLEILASYVPDLIKRRLAIDPQPPSGPIAERFPAAVLFADISGFTALTERLAQRGPLGAEQLTQILNTYFKQLIDLIAAHGGDVVKFAGDALLALWPVFSFGPGLETSVTNSKAPIATASEANLAPVVLQATQCARAIQEWLDTYRPAAEVSLSLRLALGAGEVTTAHLGGLSGHWEVVVSGPPLTQVRAAGQKAEPGDIVLSPEAWEWVQSACAGQPLPAGNVRLESIHAPSPPASAVLPVLAPQAQAGLRAYIPNGVRARLDVGQVEWLAELRSVTVIFLNLPDLSHIISLAEAQRAIHALEKVLHHYEGTINKISVDDKGASLVAALGLPPLAHEDDVLRGLQAALAMQVELKRLGWRSAIGVATGRAFCGSVGGDLRREYTMIGDVVNLAARLMQAAPGDILCDAATYRGAQARFTFEVLPPLTLKGKAEPVAVYRPLGQARRSRLSQVSNTALIGRTKERQILLEQLQALARTGRAEGMIIVEGEAGIGKSRLVADLIEQARTLEVPCLVGGGDAIEKSSPYYAWRPIIRHLLQLLDRPTDGQSPHDQVLAQLAFKPEFLSLAPLLDPVLPFDWPDNEVTRQMSGQVRADNTNKFLVGLLADFPALSNRPYLLVLEDSHWLDSASWAVARLARRQIPHMLLVIVTRPLRDPVPAEYRQFLESPQTHHLALAPLAPAEVERLVRQRLGVKKLPGPVAALIREKAQGHPLFGEELAYTLRDQGIIRIEEGNCQLARGVSDLRGLDFPDTLQGVITSRIDQLRPQPQLTLKVASVIGHSFPVPALCEVYPIEADKPFLPDYLQTLRRLDIMQPDALKPDSTYLFKQIITQEIAYNLLPFAQRRRLHAETARWHERTYVADLDIFYPLLAHHWHKAGRPDQAIDYLEKAGEGALRAGAYQEAINFFQEALQLDSRPEGNKNGGLVSPQGSGHIADSPLRRARWERQLGQAYYGLGNLAESQQHLHRALALLGQPMQVGLSKVAAGVLGQLLQQIFHRAWSGIIRFRWPFGQQRQTAGGRLTTADIALEAARSYEHLAQMSYLANEAGPAIYAALRALNLAEQAEPSPELARGYAVVGGAAGVIPLHRQARAYGRRARKTARQMQDRSALAWVLTVTGAYSVGVGDWSDAETALKEAIALYDSFGDRRGWGDSLAVLGWADYFRGEFSRAPAWMTELYTTARASDNLEHQAWALFGRAIHLLRQGYTEATVAMLEEATNLFQRMPGSRLAEMDNYAALAVARLRQGAVHQAREAADVAAALRAQSSPTAFAALDGYANIAKVYLTLWEIEIGLDFRQPTLDRSKVESLNRTSNIHNLKSKAGRACKALHRYAWSYPIGRPQTWLWRGLYHWLNGQPGRAQTTWQRALAEAQRLHMPYDQALAHYEIGRHLAAGDPNRQPHLSRAVAIFAGLEAGYDLARARTALDDQRPSDRSERTTVRGY